MNASVQLLLERGVHHSVPAQRSLAREGLADDHDLEVALRSGRHRVHVALVEHLDFVGLEGGVQLAEDGLFHGATRGGGSGHGTQ